MAADRPESRGNAGILPCQRSLFEIPDEVAYFNCAYMTPSLAAVRQAGEAGVGRKSRPWELTPPDFFTESEQARSAFARLIGATAEDVAIVPSASYGIETAARNLAVGPGQEILVIAEQFPSNVYPWQVLAERDGATVRTIARGNDGGFTSGLLQAIGPQTAIAALPHCHWSDGALLDLAAIGAALRRQGAALVLDVTQSLGALPLDVAEIRPDFMVCASYKWLLGPYSLGFLFVAPERQDGEPLENNWIAREGSEDFRRLATYSDAYAAGARRFDMGERSNFALMPMALTALEQLLEWTPPAIAASLGATTARIAGELGAAGAVVAGAGMRAPHFLGVRLPGGLPDDLPQRLVAENIHVSVRGDSVRVTPHLHVSDADIERLCAAMRRHCGLDQRP
ncbi:aminotransferase class V-fold PLP-dependent enzyme [Marinibaculum pumilum]|uniref:Aminotransferase class V-fold PLP-dependent enzyme n=1 Tax=Marinibaculum pumilum TaxID=1766165 RepID=A0ABV7L6Z9_9PROT